MEQNKRKRTKFDIEWAKSLKGLSMKVPDNWWPGYNGRMIHDGKIDSFNVASQKWNLLLDTNDDDDLYLIAYDAVCEYSNEQSSTYHEYKLPYQPVREGDDEIEVPDGTRYTSTARVDWSQVDSSTNNNGRTIDPIEWTGDEEFSVNITDEELEMLKDIKGEIRYEKVFQWCLPLFGDDDDTKTLFEFQAARMRNYMKKRIVEDGWKPKYYTSDKVITGDHVARFYGACLSKMLVGNRSIEQIFSTREVFDCVRPVQMSMTKNALEDLTACLHYSDDWESADDWDDTYPDAKVQADESTAAHRLKHGLLEDGYNKRWQAIVNFGKWITTDESRVAGWYHSVMMIGPEPKPTRTGATLHTVCITYGPLGTYKLFARVYGGKDDEDMDVHNPHTVTKLKMVSLYDFMLDPFKHRGHCVVMESAYMGDAMCQVGREEWGLNMVGTVQANRTGGGSLGAEAIDQKEILKGSHQSLLYQHNTKHLTYAVLADNNFVRTLSNFHSPTILEGGIRRRRRDPLTKRRDRDPSDVNCPNQQKTYCDTYHLIDKGNGVEAKYDLSTESHLHGWGPKLAARYFNININNAYKIYTSLYTKHHNAKDLMPLKECINNLTHSLLQQGDDMRKRGVGAPSSAVKDLTTSISGDGYKLRTDSKRQEFIPTRAHGEGAVHACTARTPTCAVTARDLLYQQATFQKLKKQHPWRRHQPTPMLARGKGLSGSGHYCQYKKCPGLDNKSKRPRPYKTVFRCEECSMDKGKCIWLCHTTKKKDGIEISVNCHTKYHNEEFMVTIDCPDPIECSEVSDLT